MLLIKSKTKLIDDFFKIVTANQENFDNSDNNVNKDFYVLYDEGLEVVAKKNSEKQKTKQQDKKLEMNYYFIYVFLNKTNIYNFKIFV